MDKYLNKQFWGNSLQDYLVAVGIIVLSIIIIEILRKFVSSKFKDDDSEQKFGYKIVFKNISKFLIPLLYLGGFYLALSSLQYNKIISEVVRVIYLVIASLLIVKFTRSVIELVIAKYSEKEGESKRIKPLLGFINFVLYIIAVLFILDNLGFKISSIIAGIGIGGVAIALASQALLGDLFAYFVIYFDKPFELGDFIRVDDKLGVIEKIGIKSTRIRSLSGELLVISNANLTNARLHNYGKMYRRRVVFQIGVIYQTPADKLEAIPKKIREIIEGIEMTTFDRSHFAGYGDSSLNFESVYYVEASDYNKYMDIQQEINLKLYRAFEEKNIEFAYPTRTLFVNNVASD